MCARHTRISHGEVSIAHLDHLCRDKHWGLGQSGGWEADEMLRALGLRCRAAEPRVSSGAWGALRAGPLGDVPPGTVWATTPSPGHVGDGYRSGRACPSMTGGPAAP